LPSIRVFVRCLALLLMAGVAARAAAQTPVTPPDTPLKEISVAATTFVRGAPLPAWADVLPLPPPAETRRALAVRMEDTHLLVADEPVQLVNIATQVLDASALGQIGQVSIYFIPQYQRLSLHKVAILRGAETIDHTASVPVRFLQREAGLEQGVYSGVITASLLLPDVRVGDTLLLQYSIAGANPIFGARYVQGTSWQRPVPVQVRRVTLNAPEQRAIRWRWVGDGAPSTLAPVSSTTNGMRKLRFEERDLAPVELEPMLPRGAFPLRWLQFSEFADWADVARWADALFPIDSPLPDELAPVMARLARLPSRSEQASQALQWVQSEIRYYSVALGESSHRPHTPAEVLRNRYGDCKDKSFLLMRMLQTLGIPARAVLASLGSPQGPGKQLATPLAFDHAVVQARIDGRDIYLDPTRLGQRGPVERLGQGLEEASVLVVDGRDTRDLSVVRSPNRRELFRSELSEKFRLDAFGDDGELVAEQRWVGLGAETVRLTVARFDSARLTRTVLAGIERRYPGATVIGTPEFSDEVDQNRLTLRTRFKIPKLANALNAGDGSWTMRFVPANLAGAVAVPPAAARSFALALPSFPGSVVYSAEVQWPASVSAALEPATLRFGTAQFSAEVARSFRGNLARVALTFDALAPSVPAKDVPAYLDEVKKMERGVGGAITVTATQIKSGGFLGIGRKTLQDNLLARAQSAVDRSGKAIAGGQLSGDDLAQALCVRADAQTVLGRLDAALTDVQEAVRIAPSLAGAWFCHGNVSWARGDFARAEADFGQALVLGQPAGDAYYRRGHARFFAGKFDAAADDFAKAAADRSDARAKDFALLWQALALARAGRAMPPALSATDPQGAWPRPALAMIAGRAGPEQVLEQVARKDGDDRELTLAEAWFYVGEHALIRSQPEPARSAFEKARAQGIVHYLEHIAAGLELQRLGAAKP
jgi:transglutaminase-like putative cysteine protease/tetratricopeptide (TPR) repeat protein